MNVRYLVFLFLLQTQVAYSGTLYHCKDDKGNKIYQDRPCEEETIEVKEMKGKTDNSEFRDSFISTLAKMTGKSEATLRKDPKMMQAAQALAATDAAKSYAYSEVYGVSARYCDANISTALSKYKRDASDIIALGKYYYSEGIKLEVKGKKHSKTGKELTDGLNTLLQKTDQEHKTASPGELKKKCSDASTALKMLTRLYAN